MNSTHLKLKLFVFLALAASCLNVESQVLQLQPFTTFGTNGNGTILPGERTYLTTGNTRYQRGMAYNPATGHLLIVSRALVDSISTNVTPYIAIIDAATGADLGSMDLSSLSIGADSGFDVNMIVVADDGSIYAGDMSSKTTSIGSYNLYRWADEASPQTIVYFGDPSNSGSDGDAINNRWGDTLAVTGSGVNTKILISSRGTLAAILTPTDETLASFSAVTLVTDAPVGDLGYALSFGLGTSNTFWTKAASGAGNPLYLMSYDTIAATATTIQKYTTDVFPAWTGVIGIEVASNLLGTIEMPPSGPANVRLYDISNTANPPVLLDRKAWLTNESINGIYSGSVVFAGTNLYALNSDNGIMAFSIVSGAQPALAPSITLNPVSGTASLLGNSLAFTGAADGVPKPVFTWYFNTNTLILNATNISYAVTNVQPTNFGLYNFVASNTWGTATSAPAVLSEAIAFKNGAIYEPFNYTVGVPLQGLGGWVTNTASALQDLIEAGSLSVPGLAFPIGNHYAWASNITVRLPFGTLSNGPIYFSFAVQVTQIGLNTGEDTFSGLAFFTGTSLFPKVDALLINSNAYQIGMFKGSGTTGNGAYYTGATFTTNDVVFVVGRLILNTNTASDDTCDLWVNPDPSTFGTTNPPTPSVANINGKADQIVDRWSWRGVTSGVKHSVDELRLGFTWASVTPPPIVSLGVGNSAGSVVLSWPTNFLGWTLVSTTNLSGAPWTTNTPIVVQSTNNTFTVAAPLGQQFFRLVK